MYRISSKRGLFKKGVHMKEKYSPELVEKARKMLGYNPQYPLERGFVEYINWYQDLFKQNSGSK